VAKVLVAIDERPDVPNFPPLTGDLSRVGLDGAGRCRSTDDLTTILGPPVMTALWLRHAAELAHTHTLSFYDAAWAAAAQQLAIPLVSADRLLLAAGLAQTPTDIATRLTLPTT